MVLGDLIITDQCHTSKFGDTRLAFKHQWIEDDAALKPEWAKKYAENCYCNPSSWRISFQIILLQNKSGMKILLVIKKRLIMHIVVLCHNSFKQNGPKNMLKTVIVTGNPSWIFWNVSAGTKPLFSIMYKYFFLNFSIILAFKRQWSFEARMGKIICWKLLL